MIKRFIIPSLILCGFFSASCLNNVEDITGEQQNDVSFSAEIRPIFNDRCQQCHNNQVTNGNLNLTSYQSLMNSTGVNYGNNIIVPGDADASGLVDAIEQNPESGIQRMPVGAPLTGTQIQLIRAWINEGAQNN